LLKNYQFADTRGGVLAIPASSALWNAGVVGMHSSDIGLLADILHLTDQLCAKSNLHILEQFAFSYFLEKHMAHLNEVADLVFHYWPPYLHEPFRLRLPRIMAELNPLTIEERVRRCYAQRPRPTTSRRAKVLVKKLGQALALIRGRARSNEW
jgi:hypothetical protein